MMGDSVSFTVKGIPTPKGSTTQMPNGAMLPAGTIASRKRMADWRSDIKHAAMTAMGERKPQPNAIKLMVDFSLPYPQSSVRKYQMGWLPCVKKPDIDKLLRALLDGLTGIVWVDDSQVVCCVVNKAYAWDGSPGAVVTIDYLDDGFLKRLGESRSILLQAMANHGA